MESKVADFAFTHEQIVNAALTWADFNGFSGETCGDGCKAEANILAGGAGWICPCGQYNVQSWSHHRMPHDAPQYGPGGALIRGAIEEAHRREPEKWPGLKVDAARTLGPAPEVPPKKVGRPPCDCSGVDIGTPHEPFCPKFVRMFHA